MFYTVKNMFQLNIWVGYHFKCQNVFTVVWLESIIVEGELCATSVRTRDTDYVALSKFLFLIKNMSIIEPSLAIVIILK